MKNIYVVILLTTIVLSIVALPGPVRAEESAGSPVKLGLSAGPLFYGLIGPKTVSTGLLKIKFDKDSFKAGAYAGIDVLYFPSEKHSLSLGLSYELRRIDLKIVDLQVFGLASLLPFSPLPYFSFIYYFMPLEKLVSTTALSEHYLIVPVTYRFHFHKNVYIGIGVDVAALIKAQAEYKIMGFGMNLNLKRYLAPVDLGARIAGGFSIKGFYGEISAGIGIMDFDKFNDIRRSVYLKGVVGYRFF